MDRRRPVPFVEKAKTLRVFRQLSVDDSVCHGLSFFLGIRRWLQVIVLKEVAKTRADAQLLLRQPSISGNDNAGWKRSFLTRNLTVIFPL